MMNLWDNRTIRRIAKLQVAALAARPDGPGHYAVLVWRRATATRPTALFTAPAPAMPEPRLPTPPA